MWTVLVKPKNIRNRTFIETIFYVYFYLINKKSSVFMNTFLLPKYCFFIYRRSFPICMTNISYANEKKMWNWSQRRAENSLTWKKSFRRNRFNPRMYWWSHKSSIIMGFRLNLDSFILLYLPLCLFHYLLSVLLIPGNKSTIDEMN